MKKINLTYNEKGYISNTYDDDEFYIAQQEDNAVIISATFPANLAGSVNAYVEYGGGGDVIENCGTIDINKHTVELALSSEHLVYSYLKVGFEVKTSIKEIRFEPIGIEVDGFVNVTGSSTPSPYTVSVKVGSVTQLEPDEEPTITNTGTDKHLVLNFGIPKGEKGDKGEQGPQGESGYTPVKGVDYFTEDDMDSELSETSTNPVQNKVITKEFDKRIKYAGAGTYQSDDFFDDITEEGIYNVEFRYDGFDDIAYGLLIVSSYSDAVTGDKYALFQTLYEFDKCIRREAYYNDKGELGEWTEWTKVYATANSVSSLSTKVKALETSKVDKGDCANGIKGKKTAVGGAVINVGDLSPMKHNMIVTCKPAWKIDNTTPTSVSAGSTPFYDEEQNALVVTRTNVEGTYSPSVYWELGNYEDFIGKTLTLTVTLYDTTGSGSGYNQIYFTGGNDSNKAKYSYSSQSKKLVVGTEVTMSVKIEELEDMSGIEKLYTRIFLQKLTNVDDTAVFNVQCTQEDLFKDIVVIVENGNGNTLYRTAASYNPIVLSSTLDSNPHIHLESIGTNQVGDDIEINVEYNKDTNKVIEQLTNAIISLGGNV